MLVPLAHHHCHVLTLYRLFYERMMSAHVGKHPRRDSYCSWCFPLEAFLWHHMNIQFDLPHSMLRYRADDDALQKHYDDMSTLDWLLASLNEEMRIRRMLITTLNKNLSSSFVHDAWNENWLQRNLECVKWELANKWVKFDYDA